MVSAIWEQIKSESHSLVFWTDIFAVVPPLQAIRYSFSCYMQGLSSWSQGEIVEKHYVGASDPLPAQTGPVPSAQPACVRAAVLEEPSTSASQY